MKERDPQPDQKGRVARRDAVPKAKDKEKLPRCKIKQPEFCRGISLVAYALARLWIQPIDVTKERTLLIVKLFT